MSKREALAEAKNRLEGAKAAASAAEQLWIYDDSAEGDKHAPSYVAMLAADKAVSDAEAAVEVAREALRQSDEESVYSYSLSDDCGAETTITASSPREAHKEAKRWVEGGSWGSRKSTIWVDVRIEGEDGYESQITVTLDPEEPACQPLSEEAEARRSDSDSEEGHRWRSPHSIVGGCESNPGVWGSGGGVVYHEVCTRCGAGKTTDTWATRPDTGEQGLRSVAYDSTEYVDNVESADPDDL